MNEQDDVTAQIRQFQDHVRVISETARAFAEATTYYERLLDRVARSISEAVKDACSVFLLDDDGTSLRAVALHANDESAMEMIRGMFASRPLVLTEQPAVRAILRTGEALLVPHVDATGPRLDTTPEQVEAQRKLGLHSFLVVALRARGRPIGILSLGRYRAESPPFDVHDQRLAQKLAEHASLAIDNARLYSAAQTARREAERAEEAVRVSEESHRLFFESSPSATFVFDDVSWQILAVNRAALVLYGYSEREFLALSVRDLRASDGAVRVPTVRTGGDADMAGMARHVRKGGEVIHIEGRSHLTTFGGRPAWVAVVQDQTPRVRAEAAQLASEGRLRRTLDQMMEGYTILSHDLRYVYVNEVGAQQAHLREEELLGRTPMELYPDFERTGMYALLQTCLRDRMPVRAEEELTLADGSCVYFEVSVQPTVEGLVILSMDTTERRRAAHARESLEEQLRQAQKMEAVGRLAGGIAHDFNNMLSIILGYSDCLLADTEASDPRRTELEEVRKAARRAAELTKQLLMFSRQQVLDPKVLDLNDIIGGVERMLKRVLGETRELTTRLEPKVGRIRADRSNIEQVIMNLVVNARDAMPSGGTVTIETANVAVDEAFVHAHLGTAPGPYVMLTVTDTGTGMDRATRLHIFEPFFTTKEPGKGTGLGLSTVFGIIQQSGGGIWVYSEPGHGTTFKVYLPRVEGAVDSFLPAAATVKLGGSETILLVEDEEAVRLVARRLLERQGYRVVVARNAEEALALRTSATEAIDLLLTDVVMPRMSGTELARHLLEAWPNLKVLYMSGYTDASIVAHGVLARGVSFLQKPFTSLLLARQVRAVLDDEASADPNRP